MRIDQGNFTVKMAENKEEIIASQRLRYDVFVKEMGAQISNMDRQQQLEKDDFQFQEE